MALTLAELSVLENDPLRKGVIDTLLMESELMRVVPFETIGALATEMVRPTELMVPTYRAIGTTSVAEDVAQHERVKEAVSLVTHDVDVDIALLRNRAGEMVEADIRAVQTKAGLKAFSYLFNESFINGDQATDANEFNGIKNRVEDIGGNQVIDVAVSTSALVVKSSTANEDTFLDAINQAIYAVDGFRPTERVGGVALLMNRTTKLRLTSVFRKRALLRTVEDAQGRFFHAYGEGGPVLLDIGPVNDSSLSGGTPTLIILDTEDPGDGGNDTTSLYAVRLAEGEYLWGIQEFPLEVRDLGEVQAKPALRLRLDWAPGLAMVNPRSVARIKGFDAR